MTKYARKINGVVVAVQSAAGYAATDASVKSLWEEVPEAVVVGSRLISGSWVHPAPEASVYRKKVSPPEFLLLFTPNERVAIRAARSTDPVIDDWFSIIEDPRLTFVDLELPQTEAGLTYLVDKELLAEQRKNEILAGVPA